mgnify:CR=1 FL=1
MAGYIMTLEVIDYGICIFKNANRDLYETVSGSV